MLTAEVAVSRRLYSAAAAVSALVGPDDRMGDWSSPRGRNDVI